MPRALIGAEPTVVARESHLLPRRRIHRLGQRRVVASVHLGCDVAQVQATQVVLDLVGHGHVRDQHDQAHEGVGVLDRPGDSGAAECCTAPCAHSSPQRTAGSGRGTTRGTAPTSSAWVGHRRRSRPGAPDSTRAAPSCAGTSRRAPFAGRPARVPPRSTGPARPARCVRWYSSVRRRTCRAGADAAHGTRRRTEQQQTQTQQKAAQEREQTMRQHGSAAARRCALSAAPAAPPAVGSGRPGVAPLAPCARPAGAAAASAAACCSASLLALRSPCLRRVRGRGTMRKRSIERGVRNQCKEERNDGMDAGRPRR